MTIPLVETKFYIPKLRRTQVASADCWMAAADPARPPPATEPTPARQRLVEPLRERELDVLRLLGSDLGGPDIAPELTVSLNTLRTHTKNTYAKLGVNSRRAAVRDGAQLNLPSRTRDIPARES